MNADFLDFWHACKNGATEKVAHYLDGVREHHGNTPNAAHWLRTPLMMACENNHIDVVRLLLAKPGTDPNLTDDRGYTALMLACQHNHFDIVRLLLCQPGLQVGITNDEGLTALLVAVCSGSLESVGFLVNNSHVIMDEAAPRGSRRITALWKACEMGRIDLVEALILNRHGLWLDAGIRCYPNDPVCYNTTACQVARIRGYSHLADFIALYSAGPQEVVVVVHGLARLPREPIPLPPKKDTLCLLMLSACVGGLLGALACVGAFL